MTENVHPARKSRTAGNGRRLARSGEDFDILIGIIGFWALVLVVVTIWAEVTDQSGLWWAVGLLATVLALAGLVRIRKKLPERR